MKGYEKAKGRTNNKKRPTFVMLTYNLSDSPAWQSLSCPARAVWLEIARRYNGYNNGDIPLSCREAAMLCNIGKVTAGRAFDELMAKGFICVGQFSSFTLKTKTSRRWILTHWSLNNKPPTNDWRLWQSPKATQISPAGLNKRKHPT